MSVDRIPHIKGEDPIGRDLSPILVFAVCGRTGSGASFVANALTEELKSFGYAIDRIKVAQEFLEDLPRVRQWLTDSKVPLTELFEEGEGALFTDGSASFQEFLGQCHLNIDDLSAKSRRILMLQRRGDLLRRGKGRSFLAALCTNRILADLQQSSETSSPYARKAYLIDSLKNPEEVQLLRSVFGDSFCMIGVVADDTVRRQRVGDQKDISERVFEAVSEIDSGETQANYGQQATSTILQADYFFENNFDKPQKMNIECTRLLNLLFHCAIETPRLDEYGMHLAHMAADRSACLSRQVGAAILSATGTVLSTGHNDVPQFGGGLYETESEVDNRCFAKSAKCHNDEEKQLLAEQIVSIFKKKKLGVSEETLDRMKDILLTETRLKLLIEFSRAVHAEMDAIITVARDAKPGLVGSTMYVTTYPCHNCAKHIIDAGIKRLVFLEPYSKSLAQKLHSDAINDPREQPSDKKVTFANYGGVSPSKFSVWFSKHGERKSAGRLVRRAMDKDRMLPLYAVEVSQLLSRASDFHKWFDSKRASKASGIPAGKVSE